MSEAISTAINGLDLSVSRVSQSTGNIVNALSTGKNTDGDLVAISAASVNYAANATVIKIARKMESTLIDIKV